ncbi:GNAT family N-acetyltransferase [Halobacillus litoralis]|uniref:GNAT family N-acetyltransferase n=1 Tax=Halobacillus litoralis TaxID=45668 RepID=UPI001CD58208|nr:GNAT family protein [Halobacillus litoralis]MCA0972276.1 GNAT family N-acetyltransferase [Halobacillus litoralis]
MSVEFIPMNEAEAEHAEAFQRWENDAEITPLTRPHHTKEDLERRHTVTVDDLKKRLENHQYYLIMVDGKLVGEMNYMIDPPHLYRHQEGTAWIGITIGEKTGRGQGVGAKAIAFLEKEIQNHGLSRIELGVFEYNERAHRLYERLGYKEIGRIQEFTYWDGKKWADIRMEKLL